jgi:hypothetical protein
MSPSQEWPEQRCDTNTKENLVKAAAESAAQGDFDENRGNLRGVRAPRLLESAPVQKTQTQTKSFTGKDARDDKDSEMKLLKAPRHRAVRRIVKFE